MVEYVYARHDFEPVHDDEISFRAGERIEVLARDDLYSDGWWEVRSLSSSLSAPQIAPLSLALPCYPFSNPAPSSWPSRGAMGMLESLRLFSSYALSHVSPPSTLI